MLNRMMFGRGALAALCCVAMAGCGGGDERPHEGVSVKGQLLQGGKPATIENYQDGYNYYQVTLQVVDGAKGHMGSVGEDGNFEIPEVALGKYKVGVAKIVTGDEGAGDEWKGKFDPKNTTMTVDVQEATEITVDLDKLGTAPAAPTAP